MSEQEWIGLQMGAAIGFDMDTDDLEAVLQKAGLSKANSLTACQYALRNHVGEARWQQGLSAIFEVMNR